MMITIEGGQRNLTKVGTGTISKQGTALTVGKLERALLARFPRADAEEWDRMGLLVGDPSALVTGVAVALDPTGEAIRETRAIGANVLLTHHPAFLEPPVTISPSREVAGTAGANVYAAVAAGVALVNVHTALDASHEVTELFASLLNVDFEQILVASADDPTKGYGRLCSVRQGDAPFDLGHLAARCTSVFGRPPRVWGDSAAVVRSVAIANGSAGDVVDACLSQHVDCLVCGEIRYHAALDAAQAGLCIVELGHDASELPLTALLASAAVAAGVPSDLVSIVDQSRNWSTPESTRL